MPSTPEPHEQWYVLHVLSGQENSVRDRIIRKAKDAELSDFIYRVEVPTELISEVRNGKKTERHSKLFPGYVYANMYLLEADGSLNKDLWYYRQVINQEISVCIYLYRKNLHLIFFRILKLESHIVIIIRMLIRIGTPWPDGVLPPCDRSSLFLPGIS